MVSCWLLFLGASLASTVSRSAGEDLFAFRDIPGWNWTCLPGETWHEGCTRCSCQEDGSVGCEDMERRLCEQGLCIFPSIWYLKEARCHCSVDNRSICVTHNEQIFLNNQPCRQTGAYFLDDCIQCKCTENHATFCQRTSCKDIRDICTPGELLARVCGRCRCNAHMYQVCTPIPNCMTDQFPEKPGYCPSLTPVNLSYRQEVWCLLMNLRHACLKDVDCLGDKKCCLKRCYLTCMDPVSTNPQSLTPSTPSK